jgi:hypothetical protein
MEEIATEAEVPEPAEIVEESTVPLKDEAPILAQIDEPSEEVENSDKASQQQDEQPVEEPFMTPITVSPTEVSHSVQELVTKFSGLPYIDPDEIIYPDDDSMAEEVKKSHHGSITGRGNLGKSNVSLVGKFGKSKDEITKSRNSIATKSNANTPPSKSSDLVKSSVDLPSTPAAKSRDSIAKSYTSLQPFGRSKAVKRSQVSLAEKKKSRESIVERTSIVLQALESTEKAEDVTKSRESIVEPKPLKSSYVSLHEKRKSTQSINKAKKVSPRESIASRKKVPVDTSDDEEMSKFVKPVFKTKSRGRKETSEIAKKTAPAKQVIPKRSASNTTEQV